MNDLRTAAQQALDDLKDLHKNHNITCAGTIAALERALAQQAEPVEPRRWEGDHNIESPFNACMHKSYCMTLKQALAQRAPLTDEKISDLWCEVSNTDFVTADTHVFARAIERAHGIKE